MVHTTKWLTKLLLDYFHTSNGMLMTPRAVFNSSKVRRRSAAFSFWVPCTPLVFFLRMTSHSPGLSSRFFRNVAVWRMKLRNGRSASVSPNPRQWTNPLGCLRTGKRPKTKPFALFGQLLKPT